MVEWRQQKGKYKDVIQNFGRRRKKRVTFCCEVREKREISFDGK